MGFKRVILPAKNLKACEKFKDKIEYIIVDQQPPSIKEINKNDAAEISEEKLIFYEYLSKTS